MSIEIKIIHVALDGSPLCFNCAVKRAMKFTLSKDSTEDSSNTISIQDRSDFVEVINCIDCNKFI